MIHNFITNIDVNHSINVSNFKIQLSNTSTRHLILTGKNGSGKTSLLLELSKYLNKIQSGEFNKIQDKLSQLEDLKTQYDSSDMSPKDKSNIKQEINKIENWIVSFGGTNIEFSNSKNNIYENFQNGKYIISFFDSKRRSDFEIPSGTTKLEFNKKYNQRERLNSNFIQYLVNLHIERLLAKDAGENEKVNKIDEWFEKFTSRLKHIFDSNDLTLKFDNDKFNFKIILDNNIPIYFDSLSDGYSAIISIVSELLLRMGNHVPKAYDIEGVVLIDEIETHLHVALQKIILPFLIDFFPNIQFIVSTHSPFVISSIANAVIFDLETKSLIDDLSGYSYDAIIESYFNIDKYSEVIKDKILEFEDLIQRKERNPEQNEKLLFLRNYFNHVPKYLSTELMVQLQQFDLIELSLNSKK